MLKQDDGQTQRKIVDIKRTLMSLQYKEIRHMDKNLRSMAVNQLDTIFNDFFITLIKLIDCSDAVNIDDGKTFDRITQDVRGCSRHYYPGYFAKVVGEDIFRRLKFDFKNPTHIGRRIK